MKTKRRRPQNRMETKDGSFQVLRKGLPRFALSWTVMHPIEERKSFVWDDGRNDARARK